MSVIKKKILYLFAAINNKYAKEKIKQNKGLSSEISDYVSLSKSTGCNYSDYWTLYSYIRRYKPQTILECGTGVTTIVMAYALMQNNNEENKSGKIISIEEKDEWYQLAKHILPRKYIQIVEIIQRKKIEYCYSIFRGVGFKDIPDYQYDFVFIDGPGTRAPSDGTRSFDIDFLNVVKKSKNPVYGLVDQRVGTCFVMQKIFGKDKVYYNCRKKLGCIGPVTKADIKTKISASSFIGSLNILGNTDLNFQMEPERTGT